jgi:hypothetical protein
MTEALVWRRSWVVSISRASAPAGEQTLGVPLVGVAQDGVRGVAEGRQLGAGADGAEDPPLPAVGGRDLVGDLAGDAGTGLGQLVDARGDVVLAEGGVVGAEGVGLDAVDAGGEVLAVDRGDDVGPGDVQDLVAAFEVLEVLEGGVLGLEHGAHGAVGDDDAARERRAQRLGTGAAVGGRGRQRGHGCAPWDATAVGFARSGERARGQRNREPPGVDTASHGADGILCARTPGTAPSSPTLSGVTQGRHGPIVFSIVEQHR